MRIPVLPSHRHPVKPNSSLLNISYDKANFPNICAFYHHHLMHLETKYVKQLVHPFSLIYITHTRLRIERMKSHWSPERRNDVTVSFIAEKEVNLLSILDTKILISPTTTVVGAASSVFYRIYYTLLSFCVISAK